MERPRLEIAKQAIEAIARMDVAGAIADLAEDAQYMRVPIGTVFGRDRISMAIDELLVHVDAIETRFVRFAVDETCLFIERVDRFLIGDEWVEMPVVGVFEFRGESISVWRDYLDPGPLRERWPRAAV